MNVLVTGASRGIGYELVKELAQLHVNKVYALSRNAANLNRLKIECLSAWPEVSVIPVEVDLTGDFTSNLKDVIEPGDKLDIIINNAGSLVAKPFAELSLDDYDRMFDVNVKAVFQLVQLLLPQLKRGSHIVNISSMGGYQGSAKFSGLSLYSASKGALAVLTESLAEEFKGLGISVNCLALGAVQTEMLSTAFPGVKAPVNPDEMARYICEFARNGHRFLNGKIIPVSLSTP